VFVSSHDFLAPRVRTLVVPRNRVDVVVQNTTVVNSIVVENNVVINRGPDVAIVERATGRKLQRERIESVPRVAPFEHVSRAQLAVDPERVKRGVRVADPVPASQPLPTAEKHHQGEQSNPSMQKTHHDAATAPSSPTQTKANEQQKKADEQAAATAHKTHHDAATAPSSPTQAKANEQQKKADEQAAAAAAHKTHEEAKAPPEKTATKTKPSAHEKEAQAKAKAEADAHAQAKKEQEQKDKEQKEKDDSGKQGD